MENMMLLVGWTRKGVKAKASAAKAIGGNEAYYDVMN